MHRLLFLSLFILLPAAAAPSYETTDCPFRLPEAKCGIATLPENRARGSRTVQIPIVQLGSGGQTPAVILGGGGPGGGLYLDIPDSIHGWDDYRRQILGKNGTLILLDQRGAGMSRPLLSCPEEQALFKKLLLQPVEPAQIGVRLLPPVQQCRRRLSARGIDIDSYTTVASAADIENIRQLLAVEKWHLIGFSYGSRLALEVMRRYPGGVASAVLESPYPYGVANLPPAYSFAAVLARIEAQCRQQAGCRRHGNVEENINQALRRAAQAPLTLHARYGGADYALLLSPARLAELLFFGLYDRTGVAALPFFSRQLAAGDIDNENANFFAYTYLDFNLDDSWASMLGWNINCRERPPLPARLPATPIERYEYTYLEQFAKLCRALWPEAPSPPAPVHTNKPVLIVNGLYDPATPPDWGEALAKRLPHAQRLTAEAAHTPSFDSPCLMQKIYSFFRQPSATIADDCIDETLVFF